MALIKLLKNTIGKLFEKTPDGKSNPHLMTFLAGAGLFPLFTMLAVQLGYAQGNNPRGSFISNLFTAFTNLTNFKPLFDKAAEFNGRYTYMIVFVYAAIVFSVYINNERYKRRDANAKGREHWNDWKWHNINRVYPKDSPEISEPEENSDEIGNTILGEKTRLNMEKVRGVNLNMLIQGSPGSGKTRYFLKPNLLQFNSSYVITDPSGELIRSSGKAFMKHGYHIKIFNLDDMRYSCQYNPFRYIRSDDDVLTIVDCMMKNTDDSQASKGDQFFAKAEQCLFLSIFYYIYYEYKDHPEKQNLNTVMQFLLMAKASERNENEKSELDLKFDELERKNKDHIAVKNYKIFKQGTGKTLKSILISAGVRMAPFNIPGLKNLFNDDTVHLEEIGDRKQVLFIITPSEKATFNFAAAMMYTQLFQALYARSTDNKDCWMIRKGPNTSLRSPVFKTSKQQEEYKIALEKERERYLKAEYDEENPNDEKFQVENENGILPLPKIWIKDAETGEVIREFQSKEERELFMDCIRNGKIVRSQDERLPCNVRCMLDEFANTGQIPEFQRILNTCRKYDISCAIIIQSLGQLKQMYDKDYSSIIDGCSTQMYLAVQDADDLKRVSDLLGNKTVDVQNTSRSFGSKGNDTQSMNADATPLMSASEIRRMDSKKCIIFISGEAPFLDNKYVLEKHKNYNELADANPDNYFNFRQYFYIESSEKQENKEKTMTQCYRMRADRGNITNGITVANLGQVSKISNAMSTTSEDIENPDFEENTDEDSIESKIKAVNNMMNSVSKKKQEEIKNNLENGNIKENTDGSISKNDTNNNNAAQSIMEDFF